MGPFLHAIRLPGWEDERITLGHPTEADSQHCVNVLAGVNASGKSFVLGSIRKALEHEWRPGTEVQRCKTGVQVTLSVPSEHPPTLLYFVRTSRQMTGAGQIGVERSRAAGPKDVTPSGPAFTKFLLRQVNWHRKPDEQISEAIWGSDLNVRRAALAQFGDESTYHTCDAQDPAVRGIEEILGARLYFRTTVSKGKTWASDRRRLDQVELVLQLGEDAELTYGRWSEGQQAVCYLLVLLDYRRPDILLLDEIENHLHPAYISHALGVIRSMVPQSLVTTHHPHVIFSEYADVVHYLEGDWGSLPPQRAVQLVGRKADFQRPPRRTAVALEDAFGKINAVYRMFHLKDHQLLRQAARISEEAEVRFGSAMIQAFAPEVRSASTGRLPDAQTSQLAAFLADCFRESRGTVRPDQGAVFRILDVGAGVGRTPAEMAKMSRWRLGGSLEWTCWEPQSKLRPLLRQALQEAGARGTAPESLADMADGSMDICVVANVLHECTPHAAARLITAVLPKLRPSLGRIAILEVHPLIQPEKFAVPYSPETLAELLGGLGFWNSYRVLPVRESVAYLTTAWREESAPPTLASVEEAIAAAWNQILGRAIRSYAERTSLGDYASYRDVVQDLTTIASIGAWREGVWR